MVRLVTRSLAIALALALLITAGVAVFYRDQLYRVVTHRKGGPHVTTPWQPPPSAPDQSLRLAVVGDVGDSGSRLDAVATAVARVDQRAPFDGLLALGDNAYPSGDPSELRQTLLDPFAPLLDRGVELFAILGNHDIKKGNGPAMVDALGMPGRWWAADLGTVLLIGLDSNAPTSPEQLEWLERTLAGAHQRWRIVALHHPPYSAGYHGSDLRARAAFTPLFERYGVQLVLSGHEHDYQRSVPVGGVTYVVSGGASGSRGTGEGTFTAAAHGWLHFTELTVFEDRILVRAVGADLDVGDVAEVPVSRDGADGS